MAVTIHHRFQSKCRLKFQSLFQSKKTFDWNNTAKPQVNATIGTTIGTTTTPSADDGQSPRLYNPTGSRYPGRVVKGTVMRAGGGPLDPHHDQTRPPTGAAR
jgi:hypothetical protein